MIDIRDHGGQFGGGKYRKGMTLGGFGQALVENKTLISVFPDTTQHGGYNPSINLKENYIFFVGGNNQNVQISKYDLTTGSASLCDYAPNAEGTLVDKQGNSYVIFRDFLRKMNPNLVGYSWHVNASMIGYQPTMAKGGISKKVWINSTSTHLYFCNQWSNVVYKIDTATGATQVITPPIGYSTQVSAFEVHEDLNAIFAIKGSMLMKLDLNWNIVWQRDLAVSGKSANIPYSNVTVDKKNGSLLAIWGTSSTERYIWKVDYNGNIIQGSPPINISSSPYSLSGDITTTVLFLVVGDLLLIGVYDKIYALKTSNLEITPFIFQLAESNYYTIEIVNNDTLHVGSMGVYRKYLNRIHLM
jgi:hypothetical protein